MKGKEEYTFPLKKVLLPLLLFSCALTPEQEGECDSGAIAQNKNRDEILTYSAS